jgi:hypothetical protein
VCRRNYLNRKFLSLFAAFGSLTLYRFRLHIVIQHLLPVSSLYTSCTFVKKESSDRKRIWLDIATPWREYSSHCHSTTSPCRVIRDLLPILSMREFDNILIVMLLPTSISSMKLSPTTVTRRQRPFPPRAHAISPSYLTVSIVVTRSHSNNTYVEDVMPWLVCPTRCATWGYKRAIEGIRQDRCFG